MNKPLNSFLKQGVERYVNAKATLQHFEMELKGLMERAIKERSDWKSLKSHRLGVSLPGGGADGLWIPCMIHGTYRTDRPVRIDCGLWWGPKKCDSDAIVYCSFWDEPKAVRGFNADDSPHLIKSFTYHGRTILYTPIPSDLNIGPLLNRQLDYLLKQLK